MIISQDLLRAEAARRIRDARPELAARTDLLSPAGLAAARQEIARAAAHPQVLTVCVLRSLDLPGWIRATCAFAHRIAPPAAAAWRRDFTRTVFLAGNSDNLGERFTFSHVADDGAAAWFGPARADDSTALRRLLKLFTAPAGLPAAPPTVVELPSDADADAGSGERAPAHHALHVATAGITLGDSLVHLNHLLSEAVLDGTLSPGDRLTVRQVPRLVGLEGPFTALRIDASAQHPDRLQAYAALTAEETHRA
ncbi:DUF6182 family protein [Streptomyces sp. Isolate_219]|uniref:DUF6182 family protein n=1 Tax=Streptomyces sp. Isolate_219 TaxID=2950110 RepID=UPI0021CA2B31|nr:DUF6182 family protein [Streptomyces sp. Isolate_219]MCR8574762.1 DUF6182 family protein [Streptomyces sp. Isolate_219]